MALTPYTNTYTDTDGTIADADDIVAEFDRVEEFIRIWAGAYTSIGLTTVYTYTFDAIYDYEINSGNGILQKLIVDEGVELFDINIKPREDGDPYRVYLSVRFRSKDTRFTVSAPVGISHVFGTNRVEFQPGQVISDGFYPAVIVITHGTDAVHVQVFADNSEASSVGSDDTLQEVAL